MDNQFEDEPDLPEELVPLGTRYGYHDLGGAKIRLLHLDSTHHPLRGRIVEVDVHDKIDYHAVSYTWDNSPRRPSSVIRIGAECLEIGDNISQFLQCLHARDLKKPLWIDAICIDQQNTSEKIHQIPLMGAIYSKASRTLIWLGIAAETVEEALESLPQINQDLGKIPFDPKTSHLSLNRGMPTSLVTHMLGLCSLIMRSWFKRLWTMQEYVLAQDTLFLCGRASTSGDSIQRFIYLYDGLNLKANEALYKPEVFAYTFGGYGDDDDVHVNALTLFPKMIALREFRDLLSKDATQKEVFVNDLSVILSTFERHAHVPVDSILGLMGLLRSPVFTTIPVTEGVTEREVFTALASAMIQQQDDSDHLALLHYTDTEHTNTALPSWVPNFHSSLRTNLLSPYSNRRDYLYHASPAIVNVDETRVRYVPAPPNSNAIPTLQLRGHIVDKIIAVVHGHDTGWTRAIFSNFHGPEQQTWEEKCQDLVREHAHGSTTMTLGKRYQARPIKSLPQSYISTLVASSTLIGKSRTRSIPTGKTYNDFKWRLSKMADPSYDDFYERLHNPEHPGVKVNWDLIMGKDPDHNQPLYIAEEKEDYHTRMFEVCRGRSFFITCNGRLGLGGRVEVGDWVAAFDGGRTPFIMRDADGVNAAINFQSSSQTRTFQLISEAYVHGLMDGEAYTGKLGEKSHNQWVTLV